MENETVVTVIPQAARQLAIYCWPSRGSAVGDQRGKAKIPRLTVSRAGLEPAKRRAESRAHRRVARQMQYLQNANSKQIVGHDTAADPEQTGDTRAC